MRRPLSALIQSLWSEQDLLLILAELRREDLTELAAMVAQGEIQPVIDYRFPFVETADSIRYSETGRARGKIIIDMGM